MSLWSNIKGIFTGGQEKEKTVTPALRPLSPRKKRKTGHFLLMFLLVFIALVMVSETTLAIINFFFWDSQSVGSFVVPIAVMPVIAIALTGIIIWINNENNKLANKFADAFERLSHGEFGYQLDVPQKGQFKSLFENFNKMSKELKSIQTLKDEFIHDFSHEFKTPIASINGFANLLLEGGLTEEEQRQYLKIIADESSRLSHLSERTLMLNRLENQQFVGEVKPYRLDLQIKECVILLERDWSAKNLSISAELPAITFEGNSSLMQQVWLNLLSNAIKFTPKGGEINLTFARFDGFFEVRVADTGTGMRQDAAPPVFEKYYQGDSSHSTRGNGLGLAIVKRIVTLSGGDVFVESRENVGSTFVVRLPG